VKKLTSCYEMRKNFKISFSKEGCSHTETCGCKITLEGVGPRTEGLKYTAISESLTEQYLEAASYVNTFDFDAKVSNPAPVQSEEQFFRSNIQDGTTIRPIESVTENHRPRWPDSVLLCALDPRITNALKRADFKYMRYKFPYMNVSWSMMKEIWGETKEVCSLRSLCLRRESMYHWACGKTNGHPHVVAAMANLYPRKLAKAILTMARENIENLPREPLVYLNEAMDVLYRKMRVDLTKKNLWKLSFAQLKDMYMGASNGDSEGKRFTIHPTEAHPVEIKVSPKGKKIDTFEQEVDAILRFLRTGEEPNIPWVVPPKDENFFDFGKQWSEEQWQRFEEKLRVFNIPCSLYILMERMVSHIRHMRERGWVIRIGHRWSHGGADSLARCLGIDLSNCWSPELVEGDAKLYDQTVAELWTNLYWSTMSNFIDPQSPDYACFEKIVKFLLKNMIVRLTQLLGSIWGATKGGVPSGAYNTSHMDSWIMGMYIILFCVWQVHTAPEEDQEELERDLLAVVALIVYGDDHLYRKGLGKGAIYFSGSAFVKFMWDHFRVQVRDMKDGVSFASKTSAGWIVECGATFLKHQIIVNQNRDPGQPFFFTVPRIKRIFGAISVGTGNENKGCGRYNAFFDRPCLWYICIESGCV